MKFSLIIGTLNRPWAIKNCLKSIKSQTYQDYEIIIIDQSDDKATEDIIKTLNDPSVIYRHVDYKGLSRARNDALRIASGEFFCLIDDDAYYDDKYLETANKNVKEGVILSGFIFDTIKNGPFVEYKEMYNHKKLPIRMIIRTCPSAALVIPMVLVKQLGGFDEQLGVGAEFSACEETDLIFRGVKAGYTVEYINEMKLKHPYPVLDKGQDINYEKMALYYRGIGAFYKKHLNMHIQGIWFCYIEVWIKLIIKRLMFFRYEKQNIDMLIEGLKFGLEHYYENEC